MERAGRRRQAVGRSPWPRPWQDGLGASARARHDIADVDATGLAVVAAVDEVARGVALVGGRVPKSLRYYCARQVQTQAQLLPWRVSRVTMSRREVVLGGLEKARGIGRLETTG